MIKNVGTMDRIVRIVTAVVLGVMLLAKLITGTWAIVASIGAVILLGTGLIGWCGLYTVLGINTKKPCCSQTEGESNKCSCSENNK